MSDKKINKSTLKEAKEQFEEIQKFAIEEATKSLGSDINKKVIELMNSSLEEGALNEEITINADGTTIKIDDNGNMEVEAAEMEGETEEEEVVGDDMEDSEEIEVSDEDDEIEIDNSEIEEMNLEEMNFEEQEEVAAAAPAPAAPAQPAEAPAVEEPVAEEPAAETMANPFQMLMDKMDQLMSMMGGNAEGGEEQIDIIDDTEAAPAPEAGRSDRGCAQCWWRR